MTLPVREAFPFYWKATLAKEFHHICAQISLLLPLDVFLQSGLAEWTCKLVKMISCQSVL